MMLTARRAWPLIAVVVIVTVFGLLETRPAAVVRSSFTLVGIVDCGIRSGRSCPPGQYITLISDDSGSKQPYKIDLSWILNKLPGTLSQDQQVRIEIERLPDGTLMALRIIDLDNRSGIIRDDENEVRPKDDEEDEIVTTQGEETTTTTTTVVSTICIPTTTTQTQFSTTTRTSTTGATTTSTSTVVTTTTLFAGIAAITETQTMSSTATLFPCGTVTSSTSTTVTEDTTVTTTPIEFTTTTATTILTTTFDGGQ